MGAKGSGPLAVRNFRLLTGGQFASTIGDFCYAVALPWLVLSSHGGAVLLGTVLACYGVPRTVLIPAGGVLADKVGPRTLMLAADAARCVLVAVLAVLAARHTASLVTLGPIAAVIGAGEGLFIPASYAIMPSLLDGEQLTAGNALSSAAVQAGSLLGPALGGALVAVTRSSTAAFAVDAASFAISALTLLLIPRRPADGLVPAASAEADGAGAADAAGVAAEATGAGGGTADAGGGTADAGGGTADAGGGTADAGGGVLALLRRSRGLQVILVVVIAANLASGGMGEVALPSLAHAKFGAAGYGALLACLAAGGIIGTLAAGRGGGRRRPALFAAMVFLPEALCLGLVPYLGGEPGAAAALFLAGAANGLGNVVFLTVVQKQVSPALLGRVMGAVMLCAFGSFPLSVAVTGLLVHRLGPAPFFPIAGGLVAVAILGGLTQREFRNFGTVGADVAGDTDVAGALAAAARRWMRRDTTVRSEKIRG
jgi:MFS family permease